MRRLVGRFAGFMALPLISAVAPLILLPLISSRFGADGWAAYAIGGSLGAAGAVLVELGWGLTGTQRVARQSPRNRRRTLAFAMATQGVALPVIAAMCCLAGWLIPSSDQLVVGLVAAAACATSVNGVWFFIGVGSPAGIALADTIPKVAALAASAVGLWLGAPLWSVPVGTLVGAAAAIMLTWRRAGVSRRDFHGLHPRRLLHLQRLQSTALGARALSATYIALPTTLIAAVAPGSVALFAAADRLQRWVLTGLQPLPSTLQRWVGGPSGAVERRRRAALGSVVAAAVGIVVGAVFALLAPLASEVVFAGALRVTSEMALICGVVIAVVCTSRATGGLLLVALRGVRFIALSAAIGCIVGVPLVIALGLRLGAVGGLVAVAVTESAVLLTQLIGVIALWRRRRPEATRVAYVRVEDPTYPRNARIRAYLESSDYEVTTFRRSYSSSTVRRLIGDVLTICTRMHGYDVYVVAEFSLRFAPLVGIIARINRAQCVVDCFVGKEETLVGDHAAASPHSLTARLARFEDRAARRAGHILLSDTQIRADSLISGCRHSPRVFSLPVGAPPWALPNTARSGDGILRVLFYGSFLPLHGVPTILEAIAETPNRVHLTLVGDISERDVLARIASLRIADRCVVLPPVPAASLASIIAQHDVVLGIFGTSAKAGSVIANKVWQALSCGRPVITQRSPALAEIRGIVGEQLIEVPAGAPHALAAALRSRIGVPVDPRWGSAHLSLEAYVLNEFGRFRAALPVRRAA